MTRLTVRFERTLQCHFRPPNGFDTIALLRGIAVWRTMSSYRLYKIPVLGTAADWWVGGEYDII